MEVKMCRACEKYYKLNEFFENHNSGSLNFATTSKKSKRRKHKIPVRTSTPIPESENVHYESSDSVADFFYQSWKNGLHLNNSKNRQTSPHFWIQQPYVLVQPVLYVPQIIYVSTVIYYLYIPLQQLGYRYDGAFGLLPIYYPYNRN